jgi:GST-like protein
MHDIDLYTWATSNGWKVNATLEELELPYNLKPIDITTGIQKQPEFLAINPNGRIPAIAEKTGKLMPTDVKGRSEVIQWLMFQMGGVGPMQGQAHVFHRYFPEKIPAAIERYQNETKRLYGVLNTRLENSEFLTKDFSIADIAHWGWVRVHNWASVSLDEFPHLKRWLAQLEARPALARGAAIPHATTYHLPDSDEAASDTRSIVGH